MLVSTRSVGGKLLWFGLAVRKAGAMTTPKIANLIKTALDTARNEVPLSFKGCSAATDSMTTSSIMVMLTIG
jgi:hypothetical protein